MALRSRLSDEKHLGACWVQSVATWADILTLSRQALAPRGYEIQSLFGLSPPRYTASPEH